VKLVKLPVFSHFNRSVLVLAGVLVTSKFDGDVMSISQSKHSKKPERKVIVKTMEERFQLLTQKDIEGTCFVLKTLQILQTTPLVVTCSNKSGVVVRVLIKKIFQFLPALEVVFTSKL